MIERIVATVLALGAYAIANMWFTPQATLIAGQAAGRQFENSDVAYTTSVYTFNLLTVASGVLTLFLLAILTLIWWRPVRDLIERVRQGMVTALFVAVALATFATPNIGHAFFEKVDRTEIVPILPNESAFWIPDVGDNKRSQVQMDSEAYLNDNKVALRRF